MSSLNLRQAVRAIVLDEESFIPCGALSSDELAAENVSGFRWWRWRDIAAYRGSDLFSPRDLATPLAAVIAGELPAVPLPLGL